MNSLDEIIQHMDNTGAAPNLTPQDTQTDSSEQKMKMDIDEEEKKFTFDYQTAKLYLTELATRWNTGEQVRTESNRLTRDIDAEVDGLREEGMLEEDEAFIPSRIIDQNIQREMPPYINYIKNSRRLATFKDILDATFDTDLLEQDFTRVMTYKGWVIPFYKELDSAMTHGWASVEVLYDESKPGNCSIEYIAHENLIFAQDAEDIQNCVSVLRRYMVTPMVLKSWVKTFGFSFEQVTLLLEKGAQEKLAIDKTIEVYKRFCKYQGTVYVSWFSKESACTDWLKAPQKLYVGIDELQDTPVPSSPIGVSPQSPQPQVNQLPQPPQTTKSWEPAEVKNYPIFLLPYRQTEKPYIFDFKGRVFYDKDKQEFSTSLKTAFSNGVNRSINVFASPMGDPVQDGKPAKQLAAIQYQNLSLWDKQMNFFSMPCPNPLILKVIESDADSNSEDIGQTNYAALNREDSRKTATEIKGAEQQSTLLNSVDLTLLAEHMRDILSFCWLIVRSQALQNKIKFLQIEPPQPIQQPQQAAPMGGLAAPTPNTPAPMPMGQQPPQLSPAIQSIVNAMGTYQNESSTLVNDTDTIIRQFDVRAAGDVDVIQKTEQVQAMMSDWPVVQTTPLASTFLVDLMKLKYPQNSDRYATILQAGNPKNQIIQSLGSIVQALMKMPEVAKYVTPQMNQQLQQIEAEAKQVLSTP